MTNYNDINAIAREEIMKAFQQLRKDISSIGDASNSLEVQIVSLAITVAISKTINTIGEIDERRPY